MWTIAVRKEIDGYEDDMGDPKFKYNQSMLAWKTGFDKAEEERRQRWECHLNNPTSTQLTELANRVRMKMTIEQFSERTAKTYREISMIIHEALRLKASKKPLHFKVSYRMSRNEVIDILMADVEIKV